jgi:hypothetical protein
MFGNQSISPLEVPELARPLLYHLSPNYNPFRFGYFWHRAWICFAQIGEVTGLQHNVQLLLVEMGFH